MDRIYHTWDEWECYPAGFYEEKPPKGWTAEDCEETYRQLLSDPEEFARCLSHIIVEWVNSCEHYLTNDKMNRIAWLGQAALAWKHGIPSRFRGGYNLLTQEQKDKANEVALEYLNKWRELYGEPPLSMEEAQPRTKVELY